MKLHNSVISVILLLIFSCVFCDVELDLGDLSYSGVWSAQGQRDGETVKLASAVPGGIYSDLLHDGMLNQSLYYRFNDVEYRWVSEVDWTFSRHFTVSQELLDCAGVWLICEGIDTVSNISVNGKLIGKTVNQFVRYEFDVKDALNLGLNSIEVSIRSPSAHATEKYEEQAKNYIVPPKCPPPESHGVCHVNHIRKMQASFSWDWGPAFPNMGIWKPIKIAGFDYLRLQDVMVKAYPWEDGNGVAGDIYGPWKVVPELRISISVHEPTNISYTAVIENMQAQGSGYFVVSGPFQGEVSLRAIATRNLTKEDLWWPNGPIGRPTLQRMTLCLSLTSSMSEPLVCQNITFGFRTVRLVQEPVDPNNSTKGLSFYFMVNDHAIFAKGSNWIPADILTERITPQYLRNLLTSAKDANMNMLRVWGGGIYEIDEFYQLADELGLMIWQDMMFACAMYPTDDAFLETVRQELTTQLWRLQRHPAIVVWAGNNENEAALRGNWYGTKSNFDLYKSDYVKLYVDTVLDEVNMVLLDMGTRNFFVVSSPSNGDESVAEGYVAENPYSNLYGDVHVYDYIHDMWNTSIYPRTRFASEYGLQSWPSMISLADISEPEDLVNNSEFVSHRQHHPLGNAELVAEIKQHFKLPNDINTPGGFEDFVYLSQINQALAIRSETEFYRRGMSELAENGQGYTMGAMFWQLNDIWQAPTWAGIEYGGRWKPLQYEARRFFAPLMVSPYITGPDGPTRTIKVYAISDLPVNKTGSLRADIYRWDKFEAPHSFVMPNRTFAANSAKMVWSVPLYNFIPDPALLFPRFTLIDDEGAAISEPNDLFVTSFENIVLSIANVRISKVESSHVDNRLSTNSFTIHIAADAPAPFVWLETSFAGRFSDNGFVMMESTMSVIFVSEEATDAVTLKKTLTVRSLQDAYQ